MIKSEKNNNHKQTPLFSRFESLALCLKRFLKALDNLNFLKGLKRILILSLGPQNFQKVQESKIGLSKSSFERQVTFELYSIWCIWCNDITIHVALNKIIDQQYHLH